MQRFLALVVSVCGFFSAAHGATFVVLPFFNASQNGNIDWIGDSLSESITEALSSEGMLALDRDERGEAYRRLSIRPYALLTKASVIKIAEALDAEQVVYGSFDLKPSSDASSRGSLEIHAHLLDLKKLKEGPEFTETGALEDLAILQRHLAWQTLQFVIPKTAPPEQAFSAQHPAIRVDAIESYIRGLLAAAPDEKHRLFTQAVRLDPNFSQACFQLGRLHFQRKDYKVAADWLQKVAPADVHYREANFLLGVSRYNSADYAGAQMAFQTVAQIVPLNEVYNDLGAAQSRRNLPDAVESFKKAMDGDPTDPAYQFNVGYALWKRGDFDGAAARFRAVLERDPSDTQATSMLGRCLSRSGPRPGDIKTEGLERIKTNYEETAWWQLKAALQPEKP